MDTATRPTIDLSLCTECGWRVRNPREYHPLAACAIVKEVRRMTGRVEDPMPYLRTITADMAHVNEDGVFEDKSDD